MSDDKKKHNFCNDKISTLCYKVTDEMNDLITNFHSTSFFLRSIHQTLSAPGYFCIYAVILSFISHLSSLWCGLRLVAQSSTKNRLYELWLLFSSSSSVSLYHIQKIITTYIYQKKKIESTVKYLIFVHTAISPHLYLFTIACKANKQWVREIEEGGCIEQKATSGPFTNISFFKIFIFSLA